MNLMAIAMSGIETVLLPLASALLLEELTYGGLVRLLLAPRPNTKKQSGLQNHRGETKMIAMKLMLMVAGVLLLASAVEIPLMSLWIRFRNARRKAAGDEAIVEAPAAEKKMIEWRRPAALAVAGCIPLLMAEGIVVVPSGMGGVRISQVNGTLPGTCTLEHILLPR